MDRPKAPGLVWIRGKPYWVPPKRDIKAGYVPKTRALAHVDSPSQIVALCEAYNADLRLWRTGYNRPAEDWDYTIGMLLNRYQSDADSPYQSLRPGSLVPYRHYVPKLIDEVGKRLVTTVTGVDLMRWHKVWADGDRLLAASAMKRAVLAASVSYGVMLRFDGCADFLAVIKETNKKIPQPRRREHVITAEQVVAARTSAHANGRPGWALAYALAFETTLRLWDVIGQWVPLATEGVSDVTAYGKKWFGLRWECIGPDMVLRYVPSKTSGKTGKTVTYPLARAPMVLEELAHWPEPRRGPVVLFGKRPALAAHFQKGWRTDATAAGIDTKVWARDLRASGITEARAGDANLDDAAMVAGHAGTHTTGTVYDRANLQAAERFADARLKQRKSTAK
ncbi:hypothetical protein [Mesorhizobium sp. M0146]|uniref:hypothetical protein n=1 Tax=unclassified Mesorhizobium TaxID=325217 RepID=UPI003338B36A